jgi:hypothetical protein
MDRKETGAESRLSGRLDLLEETVDASLNPDNNLGHSLLRGRGAVDAQ